VGDFSFVPGVFLRLFWKILPDTGIIAEVELPLQPIFKHSNFFTNKKKEKSMLILEIKDGDTIDKVLKKYKRKYEKSGILKELRRRKAFTKPSVERRAEVLKAVYKEDMYGNKND
jgi:small subunit ribosomal protein S21